VFGGAIHKYRHWPPLTGAGAYGVFEKINAFNLDLEGIGRFLKHSGYHGPFSVEFVHTNDKRNYFMEVNFRNEGLAYASTCAGANLHALYVRPDYRIDWSKFRRTFMMNYSIDLLYVKQGMLSRWRWLKDFLRTRCFINMCFSDLGPTIAHYKAKWQRS
jgi:predicted ATP-grasp superfamily ATP-dependent carboligase